MNKHGYDPIHQELSHSAHHLWLLFNYIKDKETHTFYYSIETLMELTAYSNRCIITSIKELERHNIIFCERKHRKTTVYHLLKPFQMYDKENMLGEHSSPNEQVISSCVNSVHAMSELSSLKNDFSMNSVHSNSELSSLHPISILKEENILSSHQLIVSQNEKEKEDDSLKIGIESYALRESKDFLKRISTESNQKLKESFKNHYYKRFRSKLTPQEQSDILSLELQIFESETLLEEAEAIIVK